MNEFTWPALALQLVATASVIAALVAGLALLRLQQLKQQNLQLQLRLEQSLKALNSSAVGMGRKLVELENRLQHEQEADAVPQPVVEATRLNRQLEESLEDATSLLTAGVEADEVARRCGLSRAEASLLKLMHSHAGKPSIA